MGGRGRAPNDPAQRRNHHPPKRGDWVYLPQLETPVLPELPKREGDDWQAETRIAWAAWRADPVTVMYSPADIAYALDTIRLYDAMTPSSANEVRLRMDGLGLTPKGKRDLRWQIATGGGGEEQPKPDPPKRPTSGRRARLSVVE